MINPFYNFSGCCWYKDQMMRLYTCTVILCMFLFGSGITNFTRCSDKTHMQTLSHIVYKQFTQKEMCGDVCIYLWDCNEVVAVWRSKLVQRKVLFVKIWYCLACSLMNFEFCRKPISFYFQETAVWWQNLRVQALSISHCIRWHQQWQWCACNQRHQRWKQTDQESNTCPYCC